MRRVIAVLFLAGVTMGAGALVGLLVGIIGGGPGMAIGAAVGALAGLVGSMVNHMVLGVFRMVAREVRYRKFRNTVTGLFK